MICHIHLERSAGTTFDEILINNYSYYYSLKSFEKWTNKKGSYFKKNHLKYLRKSFPFIKGLGGHNLRNWLGYEDYFDDIVYVTFIRNPLTRYLSHYLYQKYNMGKDWKLNEFLNEKKFNNYMTVRFSENGNLNEAKENLIKMDFVGLIEEFDISMLLLKESLKFDNININYKIVNKNKSKNETIDQLLSDKKILKRVMENNKKDIELYEFVKKEIFNKKINQYKYNLDLKLKEYILVNNNFKMSKINYYKHFITKVFIRPFEYFLYNYY